MSKVIVKLRYLNSSKNNKHIKNHINYISNREGTISNEDIDLDKYLNYIAHRPGTQIGDDISHGLFDKHGAVKDISFSVDDVFSKEDRNIYDMVISVKHEDAKRLQYDNPKNWNDLINELMPKIAKESNIDLEDLNYQYAIHEHSGKKSFHTHLLFYSDKNNKSAYLNTKNIENIKNAATKIIFQDDLKLSYSIIKDKRFEMNKNIDLNTLEPLQLKNLKNSILVQKGKNNYKLLPKEIKKQVNECLDTMYKNNDDFKKSVDNYIEQINKQKAVYGNQNLETPDSLFNPLNTQDQRLHNLLIKNVITDSPELLKYYPKDGIINENNLKDYQPFKNNSTHSANFFRGISNNSFDEDMKENAKNILLKKRRKIKNKKSTKPLNNDALIR